MIPDVQKGQRMGLVDTHSHILPGIDDGASDAGVSEKMLEAEKKTGVDKIILTPHFYLSRKSVDTFLRDREEAAALIAPIADKLGIRLRSGAEVLYTRSLADIDLSRLCIENTGHMLIELPYQKLTGSFINEFKSFSESIYPDIKLILAHAERYLDFTSEESLNEILNTDILVQLNAGDLRMFSRHAKFMYRLLADDMAHFVGTDCHNIASRPPDMDIARKAISRKLSPECFIRLNSNAERLFEGKNIRGTLC